MVNRLRKGLWFLLIVFLAYFSSPGYPDSKNKTIHNLPVNQDMGTKSWRYSEGDDKIELEAMEQSDCPDCWDTLNNAIRCRRCVELREDCQDCCFSDKDPATGIIKCTEEDTSENYVCKSELFDRDDCDQVVCEPDKCNTKCTNYDEYEADSPCKEEGVAETGGAVDGSAKERRWQRKGCPEKDSEDLAPNNDGCTKVSGSGLDRIWKCPSDGLKPKFADNYLDKSQCLSDSELKFSSSKPPYSSYGDYYAVTKVSPACTSSDSCVGSCYVRCKVVKDSCSPVYPDKDTCSPSACAPDCPDSCDYNCVSGTSCTTPDKSTSDCSCAAVATCSPGPCDTKCSTECSNTCSNSCSSACKPASSDYYVYTLSQKYQDYIAECIDYADDYDACMDRVNCCEKGACQDISAKNKKTKEYDCTPGFSENCKDCEKRECYHNDIVDNCKEFTAIDAKNSCPQLASDVHSCLTKLDNSECFKEIKTGDKSFYYPYVASSNDALNIIWQITSTTSTSSDKDVKGLNFYTLVKVFKLDASGKREEPPAHTSMANVKSQEAAFSIYGTTNVAKDVLKEGVSYQVYLYYFLPPGEFCDEECETCKNDTTIELTYVSLILQRVRE